LHRREERQRRGKEGGGRKNFIRLRNPAYSKSDSRGTVLGGSTEAEGEKGWKGEGKTVSHKGGALD